MAKQTRNAPKPEPAFGQGLTRFAARNQKTLFWFSFGLMAVMSLLLFNMRVSEGGDDSTYLCRAMEVVASGRYPDFQGPAYPLFLSLFIFAFGFNLILLKLTSLACMLTGHWLLYRLLRGRVNPLLLVAVLGLTAVNSWLLYYASQTYSEPLFMCVQYLFCIMFLRFSERTGLTARQTFAASAAVAAVILAAMLVRTIGIGFLIVAALSLCIDRKFRKAFSLCLAFVLCWLLWLGVYHVVWGSSVKSKSSGQIEQLMLKHPYQLENGREDFMGFVGRFGGNSKLYLSKHFAIITGFKDADSRETSTPLTVLYYLIFAAAMVRAYRCNRFVFFAGLHVAVMLAVTFVVLQVLWDQYRLMIIYLPLMMMLELYGVYAIVRYVLGGGVAVGVAGLLLFIGGCSSVGNSLDRIDLMCLRSNLMGDKFVGYTPDWVNYLTACEYAGTTLGPDECAACRKPNMARIYANGKKFYGIYSFDTEDADELLRRLSDNGVTHVILGSMRRDPLVNDGTIINTLHRYVAYVAQKYPDAFQLVRTFGTADTEPAYLLRVRYDAAGMTYPNNDPDNAKKD